MKKKNEWDNIKTLLPDGWEEAARETKAIQRSRNIRTADDLLALNLTYLLEGGSYQNTSILLGFSGIHVNKNAVRKRIQRSWPWLQWMDKRLYAQEGIILPRPAWLGDRLVLLGDATDISLMGSHASDYRLHYMFDLFNFRCESFELTSIKEGEKLTRFEVKPGAIYIADRAYCTIQGMEHVRMGEASFILRMRSKAFHLYDENGEQISLKARLEGLERLESRSIPCYYRTQNGALHSIRIVSMRKDENAEREALKKFEHTAFRKHQGRMNPSTEAMQQYILLATNLDESNARILELYRARWQIEEVFHRMKTLFSFGEVPGHNPDSVKAWFYGKLLIAALCEAILEQGSFPPSKDYKAERDAVENPEPMA